MGLPYMYVGVSGNHCQEGSYKLANWIEKNLPKCRQIWDFPCSPVAKTPSSQCRGPGFHLWSGTNSHVLQLRVLVPQLKIPCAASKTWQSQIIS